MPLDFPSNPQINDEYQSGSTIWKWDGVTWIKLGTEGPAGPQGPQGVQGPQGDPASVPLVATPVNVSPADEATDIGETPELTGSAFLSLYGLTKAAGQWQVSTVSDFASTVVNTGDVAGTGLSYTVSAGVLSVSTLYYWRVRYKDTDGNYSDWSVPTEFTTAAAFNSPFVAVAHETSPYITAYPFDAATGFGAKISNPATLPNGNAYGVAFAPSGNAVAVSHAYASGVARYISVYPFNASTGFGTIFSSPATLPAGIGNGVAFSPNDDAIAVAHNSSPFITAYPWSGSGFGTKYSNPATLPTGDGAGVAFSPDGDAIAVAHYVSPYITAYPWSGSGFGTKFSNPATLFSNVGINLAFSPTGNAIAVAHSSLPRISAYPWSGSGFGTKYSDPATLPTGDGKGVAFSPAGDAIAVAHATSPNISAYPWSGSGFGTKYSNPATLPPAQGRNVAFSLDGDAIAVVHWSSPFVTAYPWSGSGFGTKYSDPATLPTGNGYGVAFTLA